MRAVWVILVVLVLLGCSDYVPKDRPYKGPRGARR